MAGGFAKLLSFLTPKRRWLQFSLGTMLLAMTLLCVWLADYVSPVRKLERQLSDPDEDVREEAAERLGYLGPDARSTTKPLLSLAKNDTSSPVRVRAVWALSRVSGRADVLVPLLDDADDDVRLASAEGLLWLGCDPVKVVSRLLDLQKRAEVLSLLEALGPDQAAVVIPLLLDVLASGDDSVPGPVREPLAIALNRVALPAVIVVPALIERLNHARPQVRIAAAEQLLRLGLSANEAAPALRAHLHDADPICAVACAAALGAVDPGDDEFLSVLKQALRSEDFMIGQRADSYLWMLGPNAAAAADDIVAFHCDYQRYIGLPYADLNALQRIGPPAISALDRTMEQALADHERSRPVAIAVQNDLNRYGWMAKSALQGAVLGLQYTPDRTKVITTDLANAPLATIARVIKLRILQCALKVASILAMPESRFMVPGWLGMLGPPAAPAVPTLVAALDDEGIRTHPAPGMGTTGLRPAAILALGMIGKDAVPAVPCLLEFLDSRDKELRRSALLALERIGLSDEAARARVRRCLESRDRDECALAALALAAAGEPIERMLPQFIELSKNSRDGFPSFGATQWHFATSIASFGPAAVPDLVRALQDRDPHTRDLAAEALGKIGPDASASVPFLIRLLEDDETRDTAATALGQIGSDAKTAVPKLLEMLMELGTQPDPSDYRDSEDGYEEEWIEFDATDYEALLRALAGIGADARDAVPVVARLANSNDPEIRHLAIVTLAKIDPANRSLMHHLRRWLAEWQRQSQTNGIGIVIGPKRALRDLEDSVEVLGPRAEPLAADLNRLMTTAPLVDPQVRCFAAFALAKLPAHRQEAIAYLETIRQRGFLDWFPCVNLADELLQQIAGEEPFWTRRLSPPGAGPYGP